MTASERRSMHCWPAGNVNPVKQHTLYTCFTHTGWTHMFVSQTRLNKICHVSFFHCNVIKGQKQLTRMETHWRSRGYFLIGLWPAKLITHTHTGRPAKPGLVAQDSCDSPRCTFHSCQRRAACRTQTPARTCSAESSAPAASSSPSSSPWAAWWSCSSWAPGRGRRQNVSGSLWLWSGGGDGRQWGRQIVAFVCDVTKGGETWATGKGLRWTECNSPLQMFWLRLLSFRPFPNPS